MSSSAGRGHAQHRGRTTLAAAAVGLVAAATLTPAASASGPATTTTAAGTCTALTMLRRMTLEQRAGQVFMAGTPATAASSTTLGLITTRHIGNAFLSGRSTGGTAAPKATTAALRARVTSSSTSSTPLLISTDQEGGAVQVLQGSGFTRIPTALVQGGSSAATEQANAATWATQLRDVGVNMNLAPVADTVPPGWYNPPIGSYDREYSHYTSGVSVSSGAVIRGMQSRGVATTAKHFPSLGQVKANTDTTSNVHDSWVARNGASVNPFKNAIAQHVSTIMVSSAYYDLIDRANPAVFSGPVVTDLLKGSLGYGGLVMTDDVSSARAMTPWTPALRAQNALAAGVDLVLGSADPSVVAAMYDHVVSIARISAWWNARVNDAAYSVLLVKQQQGLLGNLC
ncbi:glycoside hydrolase family 3 N-terminal domain-containing protein [Luteipulveratus flavus]|uniref:beta-N-acetylhexosaminidase n=1 Tax=Luteipulveratus flavus TaxID=3031728 RepID=A0ABT6C5B9_9MICO|nr:glycoside hydrolase family 3 N-terminal domain-containing protein [Luteipulveratus sp. YIM 133296]MDF8264038.1 glycoside hydrolase family 3 N-terminal domain-containing protein [Luteipulveratus sp. YIM 133296]